MRHHRIPARERPSCWFICPLLRPCGPPRPSPPSRTAPSRPVLPCARRGRPTASIDNRVRPHRPLGSSRATGRTGFNTRPCRAARIAQRRPAPRRMIEACFATSAPSNLANGAGSVECPSQCTTIVLNWGCRRFHALGAGTMFRFRSTDSCPPM